MVCLKLSFKMIKVNGKLNKLKLNKALTMKIKMVILLKTELKDFKLMMLN